MHSFLKSIGFSGIKDQATTEELIYNVISKATNVEKYTRNDGITLVEYSMTTSSSCGIKVCGEEDANGRFHYVSNFPYCIAHTANEEENVYVNKRVDSEAYTGMCDDNRIGISLIFFIQNVIYYFEQFKGEKCVSDVKIKFSALAMKGKVILPTMVRVEDTEKLKQEQSKKNKLIAEAKKGDPEAIESLTIGDIDRYAMVSERIKKEDVLSIVDTSIVPLGSESDMYNIMGNIVAVYDEVNKFTNERIKVLSIECNDIIFEVSINDEDLIGEAQVGRRFRGSVWIQGALE